MTGANGATVSRFSADVASDFGVASDPFLLGRGSTASGFVEVSLSPSYRIDDEFGATTVTGDLGRTQYLTRYGSSHHYSARAQSNRRVREDLGLRAEIGFDSSILAGPRSLVRSEIASRGSGGDPPSPLEPGELEPPEIAPIDTFEPLDPDVGLIGERQRRVTFSSSATFTLRPTVDDDVDLNMQATRSRYPGRARQSNFRTFGGSIGYRRVISPTLSVGLRNSYDRTVYDSGGAETDVFQPSATIKGRLNEMLAIDMSLGVLAIRSKTPIGRISSTGVSANIRACSSRPRLLTCLAANRGASATGQGNVTTRTGVELVTSYQMSESETLQASASYNQTSGRLGVSNDRSEFVVVGKSYERRVSERFAAGFNVEARLLYGIQRSAKDIAGQVYLRVAFGR